MTHESDSWRFPVAVCPICNTENPTYGDTPPGGQRRLLVELHLYRNRDGEHVPCPGSGKEVR